ncbi:sensor histidine kinase [Desertihabitans aurantiacus]|uniref:sensor histidine kinase n=1 Tax=Desertihabitans aurantiacus TaxID=2282477 RepID=UPI000DF74502|nr:sensor histidine kinase [Desertihabitans aurantiacus]
MTATSPPVATRDASGSVDTGPASSDHPPAPTATEPPGGSARPGVRQLPGVLLPVLLLGLSAAAGWVTTGELVMREAMLASTPSTLLLLATWALIGLLQDRLRPGSPALVVGFVVHTVVLAVGLWWNPFLCIYAFVGYYEAERLFRGRQVPVVVVVTAVLAAFGQTGGFRGVLGVPVLFAVLALVNLAAALALMHFSQERERQLHARERAAAALAAAYEENVSLQARLVEQARATGVSEERARLSREIHDTVAQGLVAVIRQLEALPGPLDADVRHRVEQAERSARECLLEARRAVQALAPQQLGEGGLAEALGAVVPQWARTHGIVTELDADEAPEESAHPAVLLRVAQEGLSNVARHARAGRVRLRWWATPTEELLQIADDGVGFDPQRVGAGHGLTGMRERLTAVGGRLDVSSAEDAGCTITARVPR